MRNLSLIHELVGFFIGKGKTTVSKTNTFCIVNRHLLVWHWHG